METSNKSFDVSTTYLPQLLSEPSSRQAGHLAETMIVSLAVNITLAGLTLISNGLVFLLFFKKSHLLNTTSNKILFNMTIADFCTGVIMTLHIAAQFEYRLYIPKDSFGYVYRIWVDILTACLANVAITNLCLVVFERYVCLVHPYHVLKIVTPYRIRVYMILTWGVSFSVPLVQILWLRKTFDGDVTDLEGDHIAQREPVYDAASIALFVIFPVVWQLYAFIRMSREVKQMPNSNAGNKRRENKRILLVFAAMFTLFIFFCVPYHIVRLLFDLGLFQNQHRLKVTLADIVYSMKHVTPMADPFVFTLYKPDIAREYRRTSRRMGSFLRLSISYHPPGFSPAARNSIFNSLLGPDAVQHQPDSNEADQPVSPRCIQLRQG